MENQEVINSVLEVMQISVDSLAAAVSQSQSISVADACGELDNVSALLDMAGLTDMSERCQKMMQQLRQHDSPLSQQRLGNLSAWLERMLALVADPAYRPLQAEHALMEEALLQEAYKKAPKVVECEPLSDAVPKTEAEAETGQPEIEALILDEIEATEAVVADIGDNISDDINDDIRICDDDPSSLSIEAEAGVGSDSEGISFEAPTREVLDALREEILGLEEDLAAALNTDAWLNGGQASYLELLQNIADTCALMGVMGLSVYLNTIIQTLVASEDVSAVAETLAGWPTRVADYLNQQADDDSTLALMALLEGNPLSLSQVEGDDGQRLLNSLLNLAVEEGGGEDASWVEWRDEDVTLTLSEDASAEVWQAFVDDAPYQIQQLSDAIQTLHGGGALSQEALKQAQRASHTLKGAANLLGIRAVANVSHCLEALFERMTAKGASLLPEQTLLAEEGADALAILVDALIYGDTPPSNLVPLLNRLSGRADAELPESVSTEADPWQADSFEDVDTSVGHQEGEVLVEADTPKASALASAAANDRLDEGLLSLVEEMSINNVQTRELYRRVSLTGEQLRQQDNQLQQRRMNLEGLVDGRSMARKPLLNAMAPKADETFDEFDALEMDQYDDLHQSTHQYIESVADVRALNDVLLAQLNLMDGLMRQQHRFIEQVQHELLKRQKVPVQNYVSRLERCVRLAARECGKKAVLTVIGGALQGDREQLENLMPALMHLLRNAVDHGIETPDERVHTGKDACGNIQVQFKEQGRYLEIYMQDDGAGLDYEGIYQKAQRLGLLSENDAKPGNRALAELIWQSGFSTRETATQISGRGIGMDAVKSQIENMGGEVVMALEGRAMQLSLRVPMKTITRYMLLIEAGKQRYAVPADQVEQVLPPDTYDMPEMAGKSYLMVNDEPLTLRCLDHLLGGSASSMTREKLGRSSFLVVAQAGESYAIAIDRVLSGEALVIRQAGQWMPVLSGLHGLTVLGDGTLVPVLNMAALLGRQGGQISRLATGRMSDAGLINDAGNERNRSESGINPAKAILVVDDSLSVRTTLKQLLQDSGYPVVTATDGIDALDKLQAQAFLCVLTDMEMPRMDGLSLSQHIHKQYPQLPVAMLTSRSHEKHRQQAAKAGIQLFLTKPYLEEDLLAGLRDLIHREVIV